LIHVWRLCQAAHQETAFSGEGAHRYGGRWNPKGLPAVYTAETQSLAVLEVLVHVDIDLVPNDFVVFAVDIPDQLLIERIALHELNPAWRGQYPPTLSQALGEAWLQRQTSAVLKVPSAIIPVEHNYILNPRHPDFAALTLHPPESFIFDRRLWR
jgi:RES domain-containing protein